MRIARNVALALAVAGCSSKADKQETPAMARQVVGWSAMAGSPRPGPDESRLIDIDLKVNVSDGWHVYSLTQASGGPTAMKVTVSPPYQLAGDVSGPAPVKAPDNNFGIETETYSGAQVFRFAVEIPNATSDLPPIQFKVKSQACSDKLCLPAKTQTITVRPGTTST